MPKILDFKALLSYNTTMEREQLKKAVADNISFYRKRASLTQQQLAEKLNYSDKAISKWERGEGMPDLLVLNEMANIFGITLKDFTLSDKMRKYNIIKRNKIVISLASTCLVWLVACLAFVLLSLIVPDFKYSYMAFIYAIPASAIVMLVFTSIWKFKVTTFIFYSILVWTVLVSFHLTFNLTKIWYIYIIGLPMQAFGIFWLIKKDKKSEDL